MSFVGNLLRGLPVIGGIATGLQQLGQANKINPVDATYNVDPIAKQRLALAMSLLNARMPGAAVATQNIFTNAGNQIANINQNASSGAQALAMASAVQGQTNNAFLQQGMIEGQNYNNNLNNLANAQQVLIGEGDKLYNDQIRKFYNATNQKNQLMNAGQQNVANGFNQAANLAFGAFKFGRKKNMFDGISDQDLQEEFNRY